ncbi:AbrB/MazE/SpoVT family DNA-binding domain-containing protein [Roseofilum sp. Guam]|uniref:AbrB/MazE/SpoVT family DNA-binding domain-containing protein n=1 Tax=Roseofilum sp. Guam TaxID=2821502 RepID=UPI001B1F76DB|nr:AbrB/MazE/SpoVT family DNA-binding domain-containing protein [Roseofilum sp. Guam]MBP0029798.1 AbrB/MazE/SpoVT family DNA-binding domain-containing protein [Roseofilum sp. Guam]
MTVQIDEWGRIQLPEAVQEQLGLGVVTALNLEVKDGKIILTPIHEEANVSYEGSVLVVNSERNDNLDIIHALREERIQEQMNW